MTDRAVLEQPTNAGDLSRRRVVLNMAALAQEAGGLLEAAGHKVSFAAAANDGGGPRVRNAEAAHR